MSVLVVGSMAIDTIDFSGTGERKELVGGSATFAALASALASHGTPVHLVGVVGDDFPTAMLDTLRARNVDTSSVQTIAGGRTFRWHGEYTADLSSRRSLDTQLNVFADFNPTLQPAQCKPRLVLLGNIHPALQSRVLDQLQGSELVVVDTMNFWIQGERKALDALLPRIDLLVLNEEEARELSGERHLSRIGRALLKMGPKRVIVKQGEYGAFLFDGHGAFHAPAYPVEQVLDPTGAGDSFAGGMLGHLCHAAQLDDAALRRAVIYGSAVASLCVEHYGTDGLLSATREQVRERVGAFAKLVHWEH